MTTFGVSETAVSSRLAASALSVQCYLYIRCLLHLKRVHIVVRFAGAYLLRDALSR